MKVTLRISVPAEAQVETTGKIDEEISKAVDGVSHDEDFSEYLIDDPDPELKSLRVEGGKLNFQFVPKKLFQREQLWAHVDYTVSEPLTTAQANALLTYTLGQLSDGIGENFVQEYSDRTGVFVAIDTSEKAAKIEYINT